MRYAGLIKDDINNGKGIGLTLFTQGCPHHCKGCQNPETWNPDGGKEFTTKVYDEILQYFENSPYANRLTLSGGDPISSPITLTLCKTIKEKYPHISIWLYTGYTFEEIKGNPILKYIDILVDGPFILEKRNITLPFRGSYNQRIIDVQASLNKNKIIEYM